MQQGEVLELLAWGIGCPACGQPDFVSYLNSGEVLLRPQPACREPESSAGKAVVVGVVELNYRSVAT